MNKKERHKFLHAERVETRKLPDAMIACHICMHDQTRTGTLHRPGSHGKYIAVTLQLAIANEPCTHSLANVAKKSLSCWPGVVSCNFAEFSYLVSSVTIDQLLNLLSLKLPTAYDHYVN